MKQCKQCGSPVHGYADTCGGISCETSIAADKERIAEAAGDLDYFLSGYHEVKLFKQAGKWNVYLNYRRYVSPYLSEALNLAIGDQSWNTSSKS